MNREKGALTLEACLTMTIFLLFFLTVTYFMRIVMTHQIVQHALNQTAKELSNYTYIYAVSGLMDIDKTIEDSTQSGIASFNDNAGKVVDVYNAFDDLKTSSEQTAAGGSLDELGKNLEGVENSYIALQEALGPAAETIRSIAEDPVSALKSVGSVLLSSGNDILKTFLCGELSRYLMAKYIAEDYAAAEKRLAALQVVDGLGGLDFSASMFWTGENRGDIQLVVCYTIDPIFPIPVVDELHLVNRATVRGWSAKCLFE